MRLKDWDHWEIASWLGVRMPRMALLQEKNAKQKNSLVSHSPFLFQGCYKYPAKTYHIAVLQLQGHLVLGFVS